MLDEILMQSISKPGEFDEALFKKMYHDLELFFYNNKIWVTYIVPLYKFDSNTDRIHISGDLSIRKRSTDEEHISTYGKLPYWIGNELVYDENSDSKYVIESKTQEHKIIESNLDVIRESSQSEEKIRKLITALRLTKEGSVQSEFIYCSNGLKIPVHENFIQLPYLSSTKHGQKYVLNESEGSELIEVFNLVGDMRTREIRNSSITLNRFHSAYAKELNEDKFLDYSICLESLLCWDNRGSIGHTLSSRASRLIKKTVEDREELYCEMKRLYDIRNKIVHGSEDIPNMDVEIKGLEEKTRIITKHYMKEIKNLSYNRQKLARQLDFA
jgi:hypothetical protein